MSKARRDFVDILIRNDVPIPDLLAERLTRGTSVEIQEPMVLWHYASEAEVLQALAGFHQYPFIDLTGIEIPVEVLQFMPASVALERLVLPFEVGERTIKIILSDPLNRELLSMLEFIMNRQIQPIIALEEQIQQAVWHYYGSVETESVDS